VVKRGKSRNRARRAERLRRVFASMRDRMPHAGPFKLRPFVP
jgi:hypothetical protein